MNRASLVLSVEEQTGQGITQTTRAVDAVLRALTHALASGDQVTLSGFGVLEPYIRSGRRCKHPTTGEIITTEDKITVKFRPAARLVEYANTPGMLPESPEQVALTGRVQRDGG